MAGVWLFLSLYVLDLAQAGKLLVIPSDGSHLRDEACCGGAGEERKPGGGCHPRGESKYGFLRGFTCAVAGCGYIHFLILNLCHHLEIIIMNVIIFSNLMIYKYG